MRRVLLALLGVACLGAVGVAVWRSGSADADDVIELTVWDWWSPTSSDDYERYFGEIKEIFEREHPEIRIRYQFVPFATYMQKLTTGYCGPNPPDVYQCSIAWAQTLWERGVLMELTDLVATTPELRMEQFLKAAVRHNQLDGHIYGVASKDAGHLREQLICLDLAGRMRWASGRDHRFGPFGGPYIIADGMIFVMDDHGVLTLVEAVPEAYRRLARAKVLSGRESWGPMALVGVRLLVRDLNVLKCLDVRAQP